MTPSKLLRWSGLANAFGGLSIAAFVIEHPWNQFVVAAAARTSAWRIAHSLHFVGAAFVLVGLVGLYVTQRDRLGSLGTVGFVIAFFGATMFVGTGMITAFVWPMVAARAPAAVELGGAMFAPPALLAFQLTAVAVTVGYVLFGTAMLRAGMLPRAAIALLMIGAVMGMIPPEPLGVMPWAGLVAGGILFGAGSVWLGYSVWTGLGATGRLALPELDTRRAHDRLAAR